MLSGVIFIVAFLIHGTRVLNGWNMFVGGWLIPMWISYVVVLVAAYLAYHSFQLRR